MRGGAMARLGLAWWLGLARWRRSRRRCSSAAAAAAPYYYRGYYYPYGPYPYYGPGCRRVWNGYDWVRACY